MSDPCCNQKKMPSFTETSNFKYKTYVNVGIFTTVAIGVWVLFLVPVILFATRPAENEISTSVMLNVSVLANYSGLAAIAKPMNCSPNFSLNKKNGLPLPVPVCSPICDQWKEFSQDQVLAFTVATTLSHIFHITGTVVALFFSFYNRKIMFKFPAILLLYYILCPIILDISFFIRLIGREHLLCSSSDLMEAIDHSTSFCYFSGIINTFTYTSIGYWWLFLTIMIFWQVWFPTNAKNAEAKGYTKYIHIVIVVITLVLSAIPMIAVLGKGGFVISIFPVYLNFCHPRNSVVLFYAFILPFCITQPAGSTFNLLTLYKVLNLKQHLIKKGGNLRAECRLLIFLFYFAFAVALNLILFTIGLRNADRDQQGFNNYFMCEAFGSDPDDPCVLEVDRHRDHALTILAVIVQSIAPCITLVYIIPVDKVKTQWNKSHTNSKLATVASNFN